MFSWSKAHIQRFFFTLVECIAMKKSGFTKTLHVWDVSIPQLQEELYIVYYIIEMGQEKDKIVYHLLTLKCGNRWIFTGSISFLLHAWLWNMSCRNIQICQSLTLFLVYLLQNICICNCDVVGGKRNWEMLFPDRNLGKFCLLSWYCKTNLLFLMTG